MVIAVINSSELGQRLIGSEDLASVGSADPEHNIMGKNGHTPKNMGGLWQ